MIRFFQNNSKILSLITLVFVFAATPQFVAAQFDIGNTIYNTLWQFVASVFGRMIWFGGSILDFAITNFVVGFGNYYAISGIGNAIDTLWGTVRDIINLTFIFGLVFIGFKIILDSSDNSAKRMLGSLLIAALLVNFSLFITKSVVDFSNIAAKQFAGPFLSNGEYNPSVGFMNLLGISATFNIDTTVPENGGFVYIIGTMWLFATAAFVFAAGGILLIIRFVVLNIYLLLSPLMFIGFIFPGMSNTFRDYWRGFLGRALFAPAYLLMIYFSYNILSSLKLASSVGGDGGRAAAFDAISGSDPAKATQSLEGAVIFFILTCVFLIASLVVASKLGAQGATTAISVGKKWSSAARQRVQRTAGSATFGAARVVGQRTVGRTMNNISNSSTMNRWAAKSATMSGIKRAAAYVGDASFDARRVGGFGKAAGLGEGVKGGYATRVKEKQEADKKFADSLETIEIKKDRDGRYLDDTITQSVAIGLDKQRSDATTDLGKDVAARKQAAENVKEKETALAQIDGKYKTIKKPLEDKIKDLELQLSNLAPNDVVNRNKLQKEKAEAEANLDNIDTAEKDERNDLEKELGKVKKLFERLEKREKETEKKAILSEEAKIIYQNQLAFIERRESEANRLQNILSPLTGIGTLGAGAVGGVLAGAAPVALAGTAVVHASGDLASESAKNLRKMYGADGSKMAEKKQKKENVKILDEIIKENSDSKPKEEKEEKGGDEK